MTAAFYKEAFSVSAEVVSIGRLALPSGSIVACDPFFCSSALPFRREVPPGTYEVQLRLVDLPGAGQRVALARIAIDPAAEPAAIEPARTYLPNAMGFSVDSGLGSFMDASAIEVFDGIFRNFYANSPQGNYYDDVLAAELKRQSVPSTAAATEGNWAIHELPPSDLNVAIFASGIGDGTYGCFWVLDRSNVIVSLFADFGIVAHL